MASKAPNGDKITEENPTVWKHMDDTHDASPKKSIVKKVSGDESSAFEGSDKSSGHPRDKRVSMLRRRRSGSRSNSESFDGGSVDTGKIIMKLSHALKNA